MSLFEIYQPNLGLLTDLYQLTMAHGYWKLDRHNETAVFNLFFRSNPFGSGYTISAGLANVIDFLNAFEVSESDIAYLRTLTGNDGQPLFHSGFLDYLATIPFNLDVDAIPEGTIAFPHQPMLRFTGPIILGQILETPLLNLMNFQTLIATKSSRICRAAQGDAVLEFGLRRSQGIDGGLSASRAAFIGGCAATSNVLAGKLYDIPVKGTHAHSWVMSFESELEAFDAYAQAMPNNCVFLVDTYDTIEGIQHAIQVSRSLRDRGHEPVAIRLDSGDLCQLSIDARRMLDEAGFPNVGIVASNDLDEHLIQTLKSQGAAISVWGVGTRLATAYDQPALGGVYKLAAIRDGDQPWRYPVKLSESAIKSSTPGVLQVRRFRQDGRFVGDMTIDQGLSPSSDLIVRDPIDGSAMTTIPSNATGDDLLVPVMRGGECVYESPALPQIRQHALDQVASLDDRYTSFVDPARYPAGLESNLHDRKIRLVEARR